MYTAFLHSAKISECRMRIKFDRDILAAKQSKYLTKIVKVYIVYNLDVWSRNPINIFKLKNYLFGATSIVKNGDKKKVCV